MRPKIAAPNALHSVSFLALKQLISRTRFRPILKFATHRTLAVCASPSCVACLVPRVYTYGRFRFFDDFAHRHVHSCCARQRGILASDYSSSEEQGGGRVFP